MVISIMIKLKPIVDLATSVFAGQFSYQHETNSEKKDDEMKVTSDD